MKNLFVLLSVCMIVVIILTSLPGCGVKSLDSTATTSQIPSTASSDELIAASSNFVVPDWFTDYPSIIKEYQNFIDYLINHNADIENALDNNIFNAPTSDSTLSYHWGCMQSEANLHIYYNKETPNVYYSQPISDIKNAFGYAIKDINGDGSSELILLFQDYTVFAVFSTVNGKPNLLDAFWSRHRCNIDATGLLYVYSSGGASDWDYTTYQISQDDSQLLQVEKYGIESDSGAGSTVHYYKVINDEKQTISEAEFTEYTTKFSAISTKDAGLTFTPLFN